jgi:hypothetical protein
MESDLPAVRGHVPGFSQVGNNLPGAFLVFDQPVVKAVHNGQLSLDAGQPAGIHGIDVFPRGYLELDKEKSIKDAATIISIFPIFIFIFIFASFKNKWFLPNVSAKLKVSGVINKKFQITKNKYQTNHND